jgi:OOP family OmpA-OmpF porin
MKGTMATAAFLAAGLTSTAALSQDAGWYAGAAIGQAKASETCDGISGPGVSCDDKDTSWKVLGGYQINRNLALELGYADFGKIKASGPAGKVSAKSNAWDLVGLGIVPLGNRFSLYAKAGFYRGEVKAKADTALLTGTFKDKNTDVTFGAGLKYDITPQVGVRAEWQRYSDVGGDDTGTDDIDVISAGLLFRF